MGCDIDLYVEMREADGSWRVVPSHTDKDGRVVLWWDIGRCYYCFALLAGVRNSWDLEPIVPPRGLPDDASPEVKEKARLYEEDAHNHSWLTLPEMLTFDFDKLLTFDGTVTLAEFKEYLEFGKPEYCTGWNGREISNDEMKRLALEGQSPDDKTVYCTKIRYQDTYGSSAGCVLGLIRDLKALGADPERVRIVFWFDN